MVDFTRRRLLASSAAAAAASAVSTGSASAQDENNPGAPYTLGETKLFATTALGAEVTGAFVFQTNELLFSLQHPAGKNPAPYNEGGVGVVEGHKFRMDGANDDFDELSVPTTDAQQRTVRTAAGEYNILVSRADDIAGGDQAWGIPQSPDGTRIDEFAGSRYSDLGNNPDMNHLVRTNEAGTEGYLFTNLEQSPGEITRVPLSREDGSWEADLENAMNLSSLDGMRDIGGTRINCAGDLSPWGTPISAEEEYSHPLATGTASVSDMVDNGGVGLRGAGHFFNRPNPSGIQDAVDTLYGDDSWYVHGYWALSGVELLAYYLGADPVDQADGRSNNNPTPIGDNYPNKYRYGYMIDIRQPTAETPEPYKLWAMGRASWELPHITNDQRTIYGTSDGQDKGGLYKFVAEQPIPEYENTDDIRGTVYAPKINYVTPAGEQVDPKDAVLSVEWLELGTASNREVESWIADYDDITQVDYLETHAKTDWQADLQTALEEADREVAENGNQDYITDEMITEWARQYEERGPDGVDERLRRVPFLEMRDAAREVGATVEMRKSEGIDAMGRQQGAKPGEFIYIGLAEVNAGMADTEGDLRHHQVDGGMVYRAEVEPDYNISTLEPVVVGADGSDPASVADKKPLNVDNVHVMDDSRVLLLEDADQFGRSYPNDGLYVLQPPVSVDIQSLGISPGATGQADLTVSTLPDGISAGTITVSVSHTDVATITGGSVASELDGSVSVTTDGSMATIEFTDPNGAVEPSDANVTIASLDIQSRSAGTADLSVSVDSLTDDTDSAITVQERSGIVVTGLSPIEDGLDTPTDPDGDGDYEDLNGNGRLGVEDVRLLFEHRTDPVIQLNVSAYDFDGSGELDLGDLSALYDEL